MVYDTKPWINHYDPGVPAEIDIPEITLVDLFDDAVRQYGDSVCIIAEGKTLTYAQVDILSDSIARYLFSRGIRKGDCVGLLLPNTAEFVIGYYATLKIGAVVMAMNPAYRPAEIAQLAEESGLKVLILPVERYDSIKSISGRMEVTSLVIVGDWEDQGDAQDVAWNAVLKDFSGGEKVNADVQPEDPAVFQYSGGTTGTPKCAIGLHRNLVANVFQFNRWLVNTRPGEETVLVAIPAYHVYGMVLGMNLAVKMGARMVLVANPTDLDSLLAAIEKYQATVFPGVPNLYAAINHYPPVLEGKYDLSSIKACISGSATLPLRVKREFEALTHGHLVEGYGLSEAPTATHCNPVLGENKAGSIGLPLPNVSCKVVDMETGTREMPVGEIGELIVRSPQVMAGYHHNEAETAMVLREGWLFTGDIVRMDEDGYFYIVDRKKDVIKVGGFQVWPNEIEAVIGQHPKVREVAAAGIVDENGAEFAKAWIVLREGETSTQEEIQAYCDRYLTSYKIPKAVEFVQSLPKTRVGKVLRRVLASEKRES